MATSSNFFDDKQKSLADYLPENETEKKNNQEGKPQPTVRKQYSYSNDDDKPSPLQSKDTSVRKKKHPPLPRPRRCKNRRKTF